MSARGGAPHGLAALGGRPAFPADPDPRGTHALVITSEDDASGHHESLLLLDLAGGAPVTLATAQMVRNPRWSPDGAAVTYESDAHSFRDLYRTSRDGAVTDRLTDTEFGCFEPTLSADGQWLAHAASTDGNAEIWVARADGSAPRRFTTHPSDDVSPAFLLDGRLSWIATREGAPRVWVAELAGTNPHPLRPDATGHDLSVTWSSRGVAAIATSPGPDDVDVLLVSADGTLVGTLAGKGPDEFPSFSPDGAWVVFSSAREGQPAVYLAAADGTGVRRVSTGPGPDWLPRWLGP